MALGGIGWHDRRMDPIEAKRRKLEEQAARKRVGDTPGQNTARLAVQCPKCGAGLAVAARARGQTIACARCQHRWTWGEAAEAVSVPTATPSAAPGPAERSERECPMCAETIKVNAKICRFCRCDLVEYDANARNEAESEQDDLERREILLAAGIDPDAAEEAYLDGTSAKSGRRSEAFDDDSSLEDLARAEHNHLQATFALNECQAHLEVYGTRGVKDRARDGLDYVNAAIKADPKNAAYWNTKGLLLSTGLGRKEEALAALQKARRLDPKSLVIKKNLEAVEASCFPGFARVLTPEGWREIASIAEGDHVLCWRAESAEPVERRVTRKLEHAPATVFEIVTDRSAVPTTRNHRFLLHGTGGWQRADRLSSGSRLVYYESVTGWSSAFVQAVIELRQKAPLYNLHTEGEHNFVVEGLVAHNFGRLRCLRVAWHRLLLDRAGSVAAGAFGVALPVGRR